MFYKSSITFKDYQSIVLGYTGNLRIIVDGYFDSVVALADLDSKV